MTTPNNKLGSDKTVDHTHPTMEDFHVNVGAIRKALENATDTRDSGVPNDMQEIITPLLNAFRHEAARAQAVCSNYQQSHVEAVMSLLQVISNQGQMPLETATQQAKSCISSYMSARQVATTFQSILLEEACKADAQLSTSACLDTIQSTKAVWNRCHDWTMLVLFSDIFEVTRNSNPSKDAVWKAPASFERQTTKYWIQKGQLMDVVFGIVGDAPLLVYGKKGRLSQMLDANSTQMLTDSQQNKLASTISSVYFDGLGDMCLYKDRLRRLEGAQLFRIRWYGEKQPKGNENVFLELKTHHEKWVGNKSVKERVELQEKDVYAFVTQTKNKLTQTQAEELVKTASPKLSGAALDKAINLLLTIHRLIRKKNLRPCVRSKYRRLAFQSATKNDLRVTIDQNVTLIDERSTPDGLWCLPDEMITDDKVVQLPFDIFEVKVVSGETIPQSVANLEGAQSIVLAEKFSKFLTGAAVFNTTKINTLPYWASHRQFAPLFAVQELAVITKQQQEPLLSHSMSNTAEMTDSSHDSFRDDDDPEAQCVNEQKSSRRFRMPKTLRPSSSKTPSIAPAKPARVEPKSYFANERTFVQWLSSALLLVTVAVLLLEFNSQHEEYPLLAIGLGLLACAGVLIVYGLFTYFRRIQLLKGGRGYGYIDHFAPVFLSVAVFVGLVTLIVIFVSAKSDQLAQKRSSNTVITPRDYDCIRHSMGGTSLLEYQPSDVVVHEQHGWLLVPSLDTIRAHDRSGESVPVRTLATVPGADIEGLTIVQDTIYAVSENEDDGFSHLLALQWNSFDLLHEVQRWKLPSGQAEGITYISESNELLISGVDGAIDKYTLPELGNTTLGIPHHLNARLLTDGLPNPKIASLQFFENRLYVLHDNAKVVRVWDLERGELLSEWNLPRVGGKADKQWEGLALERVASSTGTGGLLRGLSPNEPDTSLLLHLSLDSPPQVWTLAVREGSSGGAILFPSCAAV